MKRHGLIIFRVMILTLMILRVPGITAVRAEASLYIIANRKVPVEKLSKSAINRIFLLKQTSWKNGLQIIPVNREASSEIRAQFSTRVLGRSLRSLSSYWNQMQFKGYMPPIIQESNDAMMAFIQRVPGAIGYIYTDRVLYKVKILRRFK